jgi:ubiquinone/menaquinone biosynthesis C-methylase UbiE
MNALRTALVDQFREPRGRLGSLAGWIMYLRTSNRERNDWLIERMQIEPHHHVLEFGFGPGYAVARVAAKLTIGSVIGIDHSAAMYRAASRRNAPLIASGRIHLVCGSNDALGALPSGFDRVYSVNTLQFVSNRLDLLTTMYALLRPGGRLLILHQARVRGATSADSLAFAERLADEMRQGGLGEPQLVPGPKRTVRWMSVELARPAVH